MTTAVLFFYLAILIIIAFTSFNKVKNYSDFFIAHKKGKYFTVSGSLLATILGGSAIIGSVDAGKTMGSASTWFMLCAAIGLFALLPLVKKINNLGRFTLPELLEKLHGKQAKNIASFVIPIAWLGIIAAQIIASARILQSFTGMGYQSAAIISGIVFTMYTFAGGQISILKTDFLQSLLILAGLGVIAFFTYKSSIDIPKNISTLTFPFNRSFGAFDLVVLLITYASTFTAGPDIYSRIFCAKNYTTARNSIITTALILIPIAFIIGFLSIAATGIPQANSNGAAIIDISISVLPTWIVPLIVISLLSAVLSSADTSMLSSAIIITDIVEKNNFSESSLKKTRIIILIIGALALLIALGFTSIIGMLLIALSIYSGAFTFPIIFGLSGIKPHKKHVSAAIITGGSVALAGRLFVEFGNSNTGNIILCTASALNALIMLSGIRKK